MEILLYGGIYNYTAESFIEKVNDADGEDLTIRVNSYGGDVFASYGMIAKMQEYEGEKLMKVDGIAASMAAFMALFCSKVECLDVSKFLFHRADMYTPDDETKNFLAKVNADLRKALEAKIDSKKWKEVTGVSISEMFDPEKRIDVTIDAKQAKKLGIVSKIVTLEPSIAKKIKAAWQDFVSPNQSANHKLLEPIMAMAEETQEENLIQTNKTMTKDQLKADHPAVYAAIFNEGVEQERDRAGAFLAFVDVDAKAVTEGIASGKPMSQTQMAELSRKGLQLNVVASVQKETEKTVTTDTPETPEAKAEREKAESLARIKAQAAERVKVTV